jgi:hypothetical protein
MVGGCGTGGGDELEAIRAWGGDGFEAIRGCDGDAGGFEGTFDVDGVETEGCSCGFGSSRNCIVRLCEQFSSPDDDINSQQVKDIDFGNCIYIHTSLERAQMDFYFYF